jgi:hypothetical protein
MESFASAAGLASRRKTLLVLVGGIVVAVFFVILAVVLGKVQHALFVREMSRLLKGPVTFDAIRSEGNALALANLRVKTLDGLLDVSAPEARVVRERGAVMVHLSGGTVRFIDRRSATVMLVARDVTGVLAFAGKSRSFQVTGTVGSGMAEEPFAGVGQTDAAGRLVQHWSADALPAIAFAGAFRPASGVTVKGGMLRDVSLDDVGGAFHGSARIDNASATFDGHALRALHGTLRLGNRALAAPKLEGTLDGFPLSLAGEVDDLPTRFSWLHGGSEDLQSIAWLVKTIAAEANVTFLHVDTTAPGLVFAQYGMQTPNGPVAISLLRMNPAEKTLRIDTALAGDHIFSRGERTSALAVRTGAVAGVNGDYFDIGRTYQPQGLLISHRAMLHSPGTRASVVIDKNNHLFINDYSLVGTVRSPRHRFPVTQLNWWPAGDVTVITPAFGKEIPASPGTVFAKLEPFARVPHRYRVVSLTESIKPIPVTFGLAFGPLTHEHLHVGEVLDLNYHLEPYVPNVVAAISSGPWLIRNGAWYEDKYAPAPAERDVRWPVVAVGTQRDGHVLLAAVDGRHPERSIGMTRPDFGKLLLWFDVREALALDSGGSVTMVSRSPGDVTATVRNVPSDFSAERWISDALLIYSTAPLPTLVDPGAAPTPVREARPKP